MLRKMLVNKQMTFQRFGMTDRDQSDLLHLPLRELTWWIRSNMSFNSGSVRVAIIAQTDGRQRILLSLVINCDMQIFVIEFELLFYAKILWKINHYLWCHTFWLLWDTFLLPIEPALLPAKTLGNMCFSNRALHTPCTIEKIINKSLRPPIRQKSVHYASGANCTMWNVPRLPPPLKSKAVRPNVWRTSLKKGSLSADGSSVGWVSRICTGISAGRAQTLKNYRNIHFNIRKMMFHVMKFQSKSLIMNLSHTWISCSLTSWRYSWIGIGMVEQCSCNLLELNK